MKKSEEKGSTSDPSSKSNLSPLDEFWEELRKKGVPVEERPLKEGEFMVILNPPESLVEKMQKAKQEEAAKKRSKKEYTDYLLALGDISVRPPGLFVS